jgi:peptidoglycan/xylan/chitin deacetylase (PgdA/CDA1 family)
MITPMLSKLSGLGRIAILSFLALVTTNTWSEAQTDVCWSEQDLLVQNGESAFHQDILEAYRAPPTNEFQFLPKNDAIGKAAIRSVKLPAGQKYVALTFDIGEQPHEISGYQGKIIDYLREHKVKATMFLGGKWIVTHPERTQQMIADPLFEVANHSWEHRNFRLLNPDDQMNSLMWAQSAYRKARTDLTARDCRFLGAEERAVAGSPEDMPLFRFPFGACNADALALMQNTGLKAIQWDVSAADPWKGQTTKGMVKTVVSRSRSGSIVIFHPNGRGWKTEEAIPQIIPKLRAKGFEFLTVSEMLALPGAEPVLSDTCYDSKPGDSERYDDLARKLHAKYARFLKRARKQ